MITAISQRGLGFLPCCVTTIHDYARTVDCQLPPERFSLDCDVCRSRLTWQRGAWQCDVFPVRTEHWSAEATAERRARIDDMDARAAELTARIKARQPK